MQVLFAQISWYHHISLLSKVKDDAEHAYYISQKRHRMVGAVMLCSYKFHPTYGHSKYETEKLFADVASALPHIEELEKSMEDLEKNE